MVSIVGDILKRATAKAKKFLSSRAADVLVRMELCRTKPLGKRDYQCEPCETHKAVFNSCGERHCCRCSGYFRYRWLKNTQALLVPQTSYLQIVFTVPDTIGDLFRYAPAAAYAMLMKTAAREVKRLQKRLGITAGAIVVLHTWNQRLLHHPHVHVLISISGIAIETGSKGEDRWISVGDRPELAQGDQIELGEAFRASIIRRLKRLQKHGKLRFSGKHRHLNNPVALAKHLSYIAPTGYRVFVQHAPEGCDEPETVVKYLARYVSGGPISDQRIVSAENGKVTMLVRDNDSAAPGERKSQNEITIPEVEFVRRWALHILPKGFVRVRSYGHASHAKQDAYLARCRKLLGLPEPEDESLSGDADALEGGLEELENGEPVEPVDLFGNVDVGEVDVFQIEDEDGFEIDIFGGVSQKCPKCGAKMKCVSYKFRPSWSDVMAGPDRPDWYET